MAKEKTGMVMCYVRLGEPVRTVCTKKHRGGKCTKAHEVPPDAVWHGEWKLEFLGDLQAHVSDQRRIIHNDLRRWSNKKRRLGSVAAAPAFAAYHKKLMEEHAATRPKLFINPKI